MADPNLEEFLRKAAERRKQRTEKPLAQRSTSQHSNMPSTATRSEVVEADIVEPEIIELGDIGTLSGRPAATSHLPNPNHLAQEIDQSDERMNAHMHQVFDHRVGHLEKKGRKGNKRSKRPVPGSQQADVTNTATSVQRAKSNDVSLELMQMLRDPASLKVAFIVNEIFTRKFE